MSDNSNQAGSTGDHAVQSPQVTTLDLSRYRAGPLVERLTDLFSLPYALRRIVLMMLVFSILVPVACALVLPFDEFSAALQTGVYGYSVLVGFLLGFLFGLIRVVAIAMRNVEQILSTILSITGQVAEDYDQLQTGQVRMPSGGELIEQVYQQVALPVMEKTMRRSLGPLALPIIWMYRRTLGTAIQLVISSTQRQVSPQRQADELSSSAAAGMGVIAKYSQRIQQFTTRVADVVSHIGSRIRFFATFPLYGLFIGFALISALPLLITWLVVRGW